MAVKSCSQPGSQAIPRQKAICISTIIDHFFLNAADTFWYAESSLRPLLGTIFARSLSAWNIYMDKMLQHLLLEAPFTELKVKRNQDLLFLNYFLPCYR